MPLSNTIACFDAKAERNTPHRTPGKRSVFLPSASGRLAVTWSIRGVYYGFVSQDDLINRSPRTVSTCGVTTPRSPAPRTPPAAGMRCFRAPGIRNATTFLSAQDLCSSNAPIWAATRPAPRCWHPARWQRVHGHKHIPERRRVARCRGGRAVAGQARRPAGYYRMSTTNVTGKGSRTLINSNTFTASRRRVCC